MSYVHAHHAIWLPCMYKPRDCNAVPSDELHPLTLEMPSGHGSLLGITGTSLMLQSTSCSECKLHGSSDRRGAFDTHGQVGSPNICSNRLLGLNLAWVLLRYTVLNIRCMKLRTETLVALLPRSCSAGGPPSLGAP